MIFAQAQSHRSAANITLKLTFIVASISLVLAFGLGWKGSQAARPGKLRLIPWSFLMMLAFAAFIATAVHFITLICDVSHQDELPYPNG